MSYMRSRGGRLRSGDRPQYEDFTPASEWNHEQGASILLFHLPGNFFILFWEYYKASRF